MLLWHQQYLACCTELNQWDTVVEYAKVTDNCPMQIDAMVQLHDWQTLKAVCWPLRTCIQSGAWWQLLSVCGWAWLPNNLCPRPRADGAAQGPD